MSVMKSSNDKSNSKFRKIIQNKFLFSFPIWAYPILLILHRLRVGVDVRSLFSVAFTFYILWVIIFSVVHFISLREEGSGTVSAFFGTAIYLVLSAVIFMMILIFEHQFLWDCF